MRGGAGWRYSDNGRAASVAPAGWWMVEVQRCGVLFQTGGEMCVAQSTCTRGAELSSFREW